MRFITTLLIVLSVFYSCPLYAQDGPWQLKETQDGIPVYTRKLDNSPILEFKAHVVVDASLPKVIALFEDEKQIPNWYYQCVRSTLVKNEDPKNKIIYLMLHFPWPVAARDFVFRRTRLENQPDGTVTYSLTALPDQLPKVKGVIRVQTIQSIWTFKPLSDKQTEMFFQQHTEPGGSIPASLINKISVNTPYYSLKNFRKLITGKDV